MTGKSKWSDETQRDFVVAFISRTPSNYQFPPNTEIPSDKTLSRWIDKWNPIIQEEIRQDRMRQNQTRKDRIPTPPKKVRHDERAFFQVPIRFLSDCRDAVSTHLSAYKNYTNDKSVRQRVNMNKLKQHLEEVDK